MVDIDLSLGEHSVLWTLADYANLTASITVADAGVTCNSVTGGACYATLPVTAPGVLITAGAPFTVTGYLAEAAGVTICDYIDSAGWDSMVADHILALYYKFKGWDTVAESTRLKIPVDKRPAAFPDTITSDYLLGTFYYFKGWKALGNTKTGCSYT